jgi:hypothetical protein
MSCGVIRPQAPPNDAVEGVPASSKATDPPLSLETATRTIDTCADRPATGFTLELPLPPSVNKYDKRLGNKSPAVLKWRRICDGYLYADWREIKRKAIKGEFLVNITWSMAEFGHSDWDNRIKPLMDYLQDIELIENDKLCRSAAVGWGDTSFGCRVRVEPARTPRC